MIKDSREPQGEPASEQSEQSEGSLNKQVFSDSKTSVGEKKKKKRETPTSPASGVING